RSSTSVNPRHFADLVIDASAQNELYVTGLCLLRYGNVRRSLFSITKPFSCACAGGLEKALCRWVPTGPFRRRLPLEGLGTGPHARRKTRCSYRHLTHR